MDAQKSTPIKKSGADSLLETKIKTESTEKITIKSGGLLFVPVMIQTYKSRRRTVYPSLDGLYNDMIKNNILEETDDITEKNNSLDESDVERISIFKLRNIILSYFMSDEYYQNNTNEIKRYFEPKVAMLAEKEDGSLIQVFIENPFSQNYAKEIFEKIETKSTVELDYNSKNELSIKINDTYLNVYINNDIEDMYLENMFMSKYNQDESLCWKYLDKSSYNDWLKVDIESFTEKENGDYELTLKELDYTWTLDNPEFWNESHKTVKLIEEFANGNPTLLESVLIRPNNRTVSSNVETIQNDAGWELAIEKPKQKSSQNKKPSDELNYRYKLLYILMIFYIISSILLFAVEITV